LLSLTSGGRKNKRTELDDRRLTLRNAKVGSKHLCPPGENVGETSPPPSTPDLLSLTSGSSKNNRPELDNRRLTLCYAKVGRGGKSLVSPLAKLLEGTCSPPGFCAHAEK